jgi:hypothetical protein
MYVIFFELYMVVFKDKNKEDGLVKNHSYLELEKL